MNKERTLILSGLNHTANFLKGWFVLGGIIGAVMLGVFAVAPLNAVQARQAVIAVKGLSCPVCAHRLEKVLGKLPGAEKAQVNLEKSEAVVDFAPVAKVTDEEISQRVRDAGFVPGKIEWRAAGKERRSDLWKK